MSNTDDQRRHKIRIRMKTVSSAVRKAELATTKTGAQVLALKTDDTQLATTSEADANKLAKLEKIKKARRFSGRHLPVLQCNACAMSRVCPKFKAGFECAYLPFLQSHKVETAQDLVHYMQEICGESMRRTQFMMMIETANGGMPSLDTTEAMSIAFSQLKQLNDVMSDRTDVEISMDSNDGSVIGQLFGGLKAIVADTEFMKEQQNELASAIPVETITEDDEQAADDSVVDELVREYAKQEADMTPGINTIDVSAHPAMKQAAPVSVDKSMPEIEVSGT